ncbi:SCP-like protein [Ancylostoma ceylanicum]|uniref:SCP-like protein n=1 Tax=Ancylostoma ceylanicum TaxID=53326 RepID=A0A0D6LBH6_9BILA|nr:SCP-like protein [Ancylostoma ceylanicum]
MTTLTSLKPLREHNVHLASGERIRLLANLYVTVFLDNLPFEAAALGQRSVIAVPEASSRPPLGDKPVQDSDYEREVQEVMNMWYIRYDVNLDPKTVIYEDTSIFMEWFANIIYNNTIAVGCAFVYCEDQKQLAFACVYNARPELGKPLYDPGAAGTKCAKNEQCSRVIKGAECLQAGDPYMGLCKTDLKEIPTYTKPTTKPVTESSAATESESTAVTESASTATADDTTTQSSDGLSQELRDKIEDMHNYYRSILAKGQIRNGKEGKPNCPTATNMYRMRYDMTLELEAQKYADSCPSSSSPVSSRSSGENYQTFSPTEITDEVAIKNALEIWFEQILKRGVNKRMMYNKKLEEKPRAPTAFTQMAWAESYKVGCGVKHCSSRTVVVCRYNPRGNIYGELIYEPGDTCVACGFECKDGLCPAPKN